MTITTTDTTPANRAGRRVGEISELTVLAPLKPGGAERLRAKLAEAGTVELGVKQVGTVHNLRWVFFDDDTRVLFATAYEGDWDAAWARTLHRDQGRRVRLPAQHDGLALAHRASIDAAMRLRPIP